MLPEIARAYAGQVTIIVDGGDAKTLGIGAMTDARWQSFLAVMAAQGLYPPDLEIAKGYTLQFVNRGQHP